jgi:hypothetical protein
MADEANDDVDMADAADLEVKKCKRGIENGGSFLTRLGFVRLCLFVHVQPAPTGKAGGVAAQPRFEIKKWNAVAMWSWDICADTVSTPFVSCQTTLKLAGLEEQALTLIFVPLHHVVLFVNAVRHLPQFLE